MKTSKYIIFLIAVPLLGQVSLPAFAQHTSPKPGASISKHDNRSGNSLGKRGKNEVHNRKNEARSEKYSVNSSKNEVNSGKNEVYIDKKGILRMQANDREASYFGVNYTLPFAYGYRSHKKLNIDLEKAIDNDVYHLARLGINAFRVHVWDTEISDSSGNLKNNEHLRLFDYLISKLEERNIRILITPIAFWGNGYPDQDEKTGSFVEKYGKEGSVVNEQAFVAQERYLDQFFRHVNPYTKKAYKDDPYIIAAEINNEPKHSGAKARATTYVNRMIAAVKGTGWNKPIFYNISESPTYADAVAASSADGFSFQWYPTGLVAGHEQKGNLLPHVDQYLIPFDTIPAFRNKPRMIYEFESADVLQAYMYPAMARSFKTAGMQWATQFAYDPMGTAHANTEYQTHYLNLAYTPSKAISLLIASEVFHTVPVYKSYGTFPNNTSFEGFTFDYKSGASEMNTGKMYYHTNSTTSKPVNIAALEHIAGVGSSELVKYAGTGAYFLDKVEKGLWRLEVMPDVKSLADPFGKNELDKPVTTTLWQNNAIQVNLPELGVNFTVQALNAGNEHKAQVRGAEFIIAPGTYLLQTKGSTFKIDVNAAIGNLGLKEFVAPKAVYSKDAGTKDAGTRDSGTGTDIPKSVKSEASLLLFNGTNDRANVRVYAPDWNTDPYMFVDDKAGSSFLSLKHKPPGKGQLGGVEVFVKEALALHTNSLQEYKSLAINLSSNKNVSAKINLVDGNAVAVTTSIAVPPKTSRITIPLAAFRPGDFLLLPRPYPGFQALYFKPNTKQVFQLKDLEKIQVLLEGADQENEVRIESISLLK